MANGGQQNRGQGQRRPGRPPGRQRPAGAGRRDQPRRQGRQGRPALLVHRARRRRRREVEGRRRLRQGQRGPVAIQKGVERARRNMFEVPMHGSTITHQNIGVHSASRVLLKPASEGTGVIAGGGVRAVLELAGIHDVLSKSLGSQNPINLVKATVAALKGLRRPEDVAELRGLTVAEVLGLDTSEKPAAAAAPMRPRPSPPEPSRAPRARTARGARRLMATLTITQVKSPNGASKKQRDSLHTLGLGQIGQKVERPDDRRRARPVVRRQPSREGGRRCLSRRHRPAQPQARQGLDAPPQARRPRRGLGLRQDLRPRPEGRRLARGRQEAARASRAARTRSRCGCASCAART